jgi:prepilin-type processing-associated H-X9-DG protein
VTDGGVSAVNGGYGYNDYGPTIYTDIDPNGQTTYATNYPATPFRNKYSRANGLLKQGKTRIAEVLDGTSNTIMIGEDAARDPRYLSPYIQDVYNNAGITTTVFLSTFSPLDPGPAGGEGLYRRFWRWAEPDEAFGVSGTPNNAYRPDHEATPWMTACPCVAQGTNAGNNDELSSLHPGGCNVLFGDGHVAFLKNSVNIIVLRGLITLAGGEVISSDQY